MSELIWYVEHKKRFNHFETHAPMVYEDEVKDFFFTLEFIEDATSLTGIVSGVKIFLDETTLG